MGHPTILQEEIGLLSSGRAYLSIRMPDGHAHTCLADVQEVRCNTLFSNTDNFISDDLRRLFESFYSSFEDRYRYCVSYRSCSSELY